MGALACADDATSPAPAYASCPPFSGWPCGGVEAAQLGARKRGSGAHTVRCSVLPNAPACMQQEGYMLPKPSRNTAPALFLAAANLGARQAGAAAAVTR